MGGVDKANAMVSYYRSPSKAKRWYFPIFTFLLDTSIVNAWFVYKIDCIKNNKTPLPLKQFRSEVAYALAHAGRIKRGRPSTASQAEAIAKPVSTVAPRPQDAVRLHTVGHFPSHTTKGRCRHCIKRTSRIKCDKCDCRLCITSDGENRYF